MSQITVRQATLADAAHITALHNANIPQWTRDGGENGPEAAAYEELTLYERWRVGGPWASVEMCAVHLANLLRAGDGIPLVAEVEGQVGAEAEIFIWREAEPFGHHINISKLTVHPDFAELGLASALLTYIVNIGQAIHCKRITAADGEADAALYEHHRFTRAHQGQQIAFAAQAGRVFYRASPLENFDPAQIVGWHMPLGRYRSAREEWERMPPDFWNSVPEIVEVDSARLHITVTGHEAFALMQQDRDMPERVHLYLWTKRPLSGLLLMAVRDWAAQHDYSEIVTFAWDYVLPQLEIDTERLPHTQHLYSRSV